MQTGKSREGQGSLRSQSKACDASLTWEKSCTAASGDTLVPICSQQVRSSNQQRVRALYPQDGLQVRVGERLSH